MKKLLSNTKDFKIVTEAIGHSNPNDIVVFDVDEVLLTASDQFLQHKLFSNEKLGNIAQQVEQSEFLNLLSILFMERKAKHVDLGFVSLIQDLQSMNVRTMALTNCQTNGFGHMPSMKEWRLNELRNLGYHFDRSWIGMPEQVFENVPPMSADAFPVFDQGVLFTNGVSKGTVLKAFLDYNQHEPSKIIFIDDRLDYIESVSSISEEAGIPFLGIHYTAAEIIPEINEERVSLQLEALVKDRTWLSDEEVDKMMKDKTKNQT